MSYKCERCLSKNTDPWDLWGCGSCCRTVCTFCGDHGRTGVFWCIDCQCQKGGRHGRRTKKPHKDRVDGYETAM